MCAQINCIQSDIFSPHMKVGDVRSCMQEINIVMNFKLGCSLDSYDSKLEMTALGILLCSVKK